MPCYHPLFAEQHGLKINGKKNMKFIRADTIPDYVHHKLLRLATDDNLSGIEYIKTVNRELKLFGRELLAIPCGQCIGCRLEYSRQWAMRCVSEAEQHKHNAFITLTYNEQNRPQCDSLVKEHLTKFMKDLRRYWKHHFDHAGIRFFACGEYTPINGYPHFHIAVFNIRIPDKQFFKLTDAKESLYFSNIIAKIWNKGFITVGDLTWNSAAYVARYVTKKVKGPSAKEYYESICKVPEFVQMSRRPGIGAAEFDKLKTNYEQAEMLIKTNKGVKRMLPCRYYDKLYDIENPADLERIKNTRKKREEFREIFRKQQTSVDEFSYRLIQESNLKNRIKILDRNGIL